MKELLTDRRIAAPLIIGAAGLLGCLVGLFLNAPAVFAGWLTMVLFLLGLPLGAMTILMVHGLTGGRWGDAAQAPLRALVAMLPLGLVFLLPVLLRLDLVFPWAGADPSALPETVRLKLAYLNVPFFLLRFVICACAWLVLAWLVLDWTAPGNRNGHGKGHAAGLVAHGIAVTIFSIDWMLSLDPTFTSTIYGMLEASAQAVGAYALAIIVLAATKAIEVMPGGKERVSLGEDVANMLFSFVLMWTYMAYMQWLIVWGGDLPDEIHWYIRRSDHGWQYVIWLLVLLQFVVPFCGFLMRSVKRSHVGILWLGGLVLAGHFVDVFWRIRPALSGDAAIWPDLAALAGVGGLWLGLFLVLLDRPEWIAFRQRRHAHG
ncbi:hypothetical protein [Mesorhizobium koreense]|jgi:hypothetical protein|uniref:hypothetical protein n=1 Tax=Mesorhizobium koreense TaxID=3074855 RepID=UPI00287BC9BA|nr:hypothetical protein [Mesorhizobium sp. WR6]